MTATADVSVGRRPSFGRPVDRIAFWCAAAAIAALVAAAWLTVSPRQAVLAGLGVLLGVSLYHAAFGFTGGWRAFILERRSAGLRAQFAMLALATVIFFPLLDIGALFGRGIGGFVVPIGPALLFGAFIFGLGMQLGGGCGSGTLFTVGGGSARMVVTLAAFIAGSVMALPHLPAWLSLPSLPPVDIRRELGVVPAIAGQLTVIVGLAWAVARAERTRHGNLASIASASGRDRPLARRLLEGPWPLVWGSVALALLNAVTLVTAGHPWGITSAFALWGSKMAGAVGVEVASWPWWNHDGGRAALEGSVLRDQVSVMDFGLVLGAMIAAALAGRFAPKVDLSPGSLAAAVVGGVLMGYGARLSSGCNIGALFGGIVSGSLHGWVWFAAAFAGAVLGVRLRPHFGQKG